MGGKPRKPSASSGKKGDFQKTTAPRPGGKSSAAYWYNDGNDWVSITKADYESKTAPASEAAGNAEGTKVNLKGLGPVSRPANGDKSVYRYPNYSGGIAADADYVMFTFYDYVPPYSKNADSRTDYNQSSNYEKASSNFKTILMYMPEDISTGFRAGWTGKSMANTTASALRSLGSGSLGGKLAEGGKGFVELIERSGPLLGAAAVQNIAKAVSGDSLSYDDIFGAIGGAVLNPNTELLFSNVDLRNFTLNFKLVPRDTNEAADVRGIVETFKKAMLPSKNPGEVFDYNKLGNNTGVQLGFIGVPKLCRVSFMKGSEEHPYLPRFKMCAITNTDVNYTPDGAYATYKDGQPVAMSLSLSFQETKIVFAEEIGDSVR